MKRHPLPLLAAALTLGFGSLPAELALVAGSSSAASSPRHDAYPLRPGSAGPRVAELKFLLRDPRPRANVFREVKGTYDPKFGAGGYWNPAGPLSGDVYAYKWRLGYPKKWNVAGHPVAGRYFFELLTGHKKRPAKWIALAGSRLADVAASTPSTLAVKWKTLLQSWLDRPVVEIPDASNRGPCISYSCVIAGRTISIQKATGAYGAAWCVSTQQEAAVILTGHTFADGTAGVFYAASWAARRNLLHAKPKVGAIVTFMDGQGHMGFVVKVTAAGFVSIEGNSHNRVSEWFHTFHDRRPAFIYLPGVA